MAQRSTSVEQVQQLKAAMRRDIRRRLAALSPEVQQAQSLRVWESLRSLPVFQSSRHVAVYLSVPGEIDTRPIVEHLLTTEDKMCYVPHTSPATGEMVMLSVESLEDLETFESNNKWGILEPPAESINYRREGTDGEGLDLILVPGLAFSSSGRRLGKGKGYYDRYITHAEHVSRVKGRQRPYLVGLGFVEQMEEDIPILPHDRTIDLVLTGGDIPVVPGRK